MTAKRTPAAATRAPDPDLQQALLVAAIKDPKSRLRFPKSSVETLATTYAALRSLERKKLIEPEKETDPAVMCWKITKAGRAAAAGKPGRR